MDQQQSAERSKMGLLKRPHRQRRGDEREKITQKHKELYKGLYESENGSLTEYLKDYEDVIDKRGERDECILHHILYYLGQNEATQDKEFQLRSADSTYNHEFNDEGDAWAIEGSDLNMIPIQLEWMGADIDKFLFQWVLIRYPHLLKSSGTYKDSKNLLQYILENSHPYLEGIFWIMELILLEDALMEYTSTPCGSTEDHICKLSLNSMLTEYLRDELSPNVARNTATELCIHMMFPDNESFVDALKKVNKDLVDTVKEVLNQISPSEMFNKLILESQRIESVETVKKLAQLYREISTLSHFAVPGHTTNTKQQGKSSLHLAVENLNQSAKSDDKALSNLRSIIHWLLYYDSEAIRYKYEEKTPYQVLLDYDGNDMDDRDAVVEMLKFHYIAHTSMSHDEKLNYLYPKDRIEKMKNIIFDVHEETDTPINMEYMLSIKDYNQNFETILQYVDLPPYPKETSESTGQGWRYEKLCTGYTKVFNWLYKEANVQRIVKLSVNDLDNPHKDSAIIKAISIGIRVDEWDWAKRDMSSATIFAAAPDVETVNLYWSGNEAIMQAWLCEDTSKLKQLKTLRVMILPGTDDDTFLEASFNRFQQKMTNVHPNIKVVKGELRTQNQITKRAYHNEEDEKSAQLQHDWLTHMKQFHEAFDKYKKLEPLRPVKIVLLDDGVALKSKQNMVNIQDGHSFYQSPDHPGFRQFWVLPGGHGTVMARFITRVCPYAELYTVRLNDSMRVGGPKFTIQSCAQAMEWALEKYDPDIISMSWSFNSLNHSDEQFWVNKFKAAVEQAVGNDKIVFASLDDKATASDSKNLFPMSIPGVIKIASATILGASSGTNASGTYDYVLPGEKVLDESGLKNVLDEKSIVRNGSSVATAIAAGLAGLIIYCVDLSMTLEEGKPTYSTNARKWKMMMAAFKKLQLEGHDRYPHPKGAFNVPHKNPDGSHWKKQLNNITISLGLTN